MSYTIDQQQDNEIIINPIPRRMSAGTIDELYIDCYLDNPSSKVGALRKAAELAGEDCNVSRARAQQIHKRLQYKIERGLNERIIDGATLGYSVLYKMTASEETGEAVRAKCAMCLIEYAGKNKLDTSAAQNRSRKDIKQEIKQVKQRLLEIGIDA